MQKELDAILDHIHYCLKSTDVSNAQYLIPAFKLLRNCYMSVSELLVTESTLTLFSDTTQYIIQTSKNMSCDKRVLSECSLVLSQTIYCLHKKNRLSTLLANSKTLEELVASLISLLSRMCSLSPFLLSPSSSSCVRCLWMRSRVADHMKWFLENGLVLKLSYIFQDRECSVMMCRYFVVILNQIAANGDASRIRITRRDLPQRTHPHDRLHARHELYQLVHPGIALL